MCQPTTWWRCMCLDSRIPIDDAIIELDIRTSVWTCVVVSFTQLRLGHIGCFVIRMPTTDGDGIERSKSGRWSLLGYITTRPKAPNGAESAVATIFICIVHSALCSSGHHYHLLTRARRPHALARPKKSWRLAFVSTAHSSTGQPYSGKRVP